MAQHQQPVRRRLSAEARRAQIIESSKPVFLASGLAGTRVRDLAAAAGVNEALLYKYFDSKEHLFEEAIAKPLEEAVARTAAKAVPPFDATGEVMRAQTQAFIEDLLVAMEEVAPLLGLVLFGDAKSGQRYFRDRVEPALAPVREVARRNLRLWPHRDYDPDLIVDTIVGMTFFRALADRFMGRGPGDAAQIAEQLTAVLFDGMGPGPD